MPTDFDDISTLLSQRTKELEAAEARFRNIIARSADGMVVVDREGVVRYLNPAAERLFCQRAEEVVGAMFGFAVVAGETTELDITRSPLFCQDKSRPQTLVLEMRVVETEWEGEAAFLASLRDITIRKRIEEDLRESEERYRSLYTAMNEGFALHQIVYDTEEKPVDYRIVDINPAYEAITGLPRNNAIGSLATELYGTGTPPYLEIYAEVAATGTPLVFETIFAPMGKTFKISTFSPARGCFATVFEDITERKQAEEEIEKLNTSLSARAMELEIANQDLESFSYTVSHDLRKPLTNIHGYCQVVMELCAHQLDVQCNGYIREIFEGTLSMSRLIDTLLNFSLLTRRELRREEVDLTRIAREIAAELKAALPNRDVKFSITQGITVTGDHELLKVVLENLFDNAWKYTGRREKAVIAFGVKKLRGNSAYFVRDNGVGFDMDQADQLFDDFQRLHASTDFSGYGIGLATVQRIIQRHGGRVWGEGKVGNGASFYFTLP